MSSNSDYQKRTGASRVLTKCQTTLKMKQKLALQSDLPQPAFPALSSPPDHALSVDSKHIIWFHAPMPSC